MRLHDLHTEGSVPGGRGDGGNTVGGGTGATIVARRCVIVGRRGAAVRSGD